MRRMPKMTRSRVCWSLCLALLALVAGCSFGGGPQVMVKEWTLEYDPPEGQGEAGLEESIRLRRFTAVQAYVSNEMVYRQKQYKRGVYRYNRWRVYPADMVGDLLMRDIRASGVFSGVFSHRQRMKARFVLEGGVERFLEVDAADGRTAVLRVNLALIDKGQKSEVAGLLFQKDYEAKAALGSKDAAGLAAAMSRAMKLISAEAIADIHRAAAKALEDDRQPDFPEG